jgi:uncharacterized protein
MMNRLFPQGLLILLLAFAPAIWGMAADIEIPAQMGYVSDYAEIIDAKTEVALTLILETLEEKQENKLMILTVKSTALLSVDDYSFEVFRGWELGQDDLLFLVALQDGKVRLDAGKRLNRFLTDERLAEIMNQEIMPSFEEGNFSQGILRGTVALTSAIKEINRREAQASSMVTWAIVGLVALAAGALIFFMLKG